MRRWLRLLLIGVAGLVAIALGALLLVLHSLDRPWLKRRLQTAVRTAAGVDIDYGAVSLGLLSGIELNGVVVRSPDALRTFAPDLVRIGRLDARWSLGSLLGHGAIVRRLTVSDMALTVVVDEHGNTSFDALSGPAPRAPSPPVPLSHQGSNVDQAAPLGALEIDRVSAALVRTERGRVAERTELRGLSLSATTTPSAKGSHVAVGLGSSTAPLPLELTRDGDGSHGAAHASLWMALDATSTAVNATLDLRVADQTFVTSVPANSGLHAEAHVRFDPVAGKTAVTLEHTQAGDGAATADAEVELPDVGDPVVRHAHGDVDLARLLPWVPAGLMPVTATADRARVRYQVDSLVAGSVVRMSDGGKASVDVDLSNVNVVLPSGRAQLEGGSFSLHAQPATNGGVAANGSIHLAGVGFASGDQRLAVDDLTFDLDGQQAADGVIAGRAGLKLSRVEGAGPSPVVAREGHVELRVKDLHLDAQDALASRGDVALSLDLGSLDAQASNMQASLEGLALRAHTLLEGHTPYAIELEAPASRLRLAKRGGKVLVDSPIRIQARLHEVVPNLGRPVASRGVARLQIAVGALEASVDATKEADAADFAIHVAAKNLAAVRPFLTPDLAEKAPWDRMAVTVQSNGRIDRLAEGDSALQEKTEIDVDRPGFENVAARSVALLVHSKGTARHHDVDLDLRAQALEIDGANASDDHVTLSATFDRDHPALRFQIGTDGRATAKLAASLSFDPSRKAVTYEIDGHFAGLAPLAPLVSKVHGLEALDLSALDTSISAQGALLGVVTGVDRSGTIQLEPHISRSAAIEGKADVHVARFRWSHGDTEVAAPVIAWHGTFRTDGARRIVDSHLEVDAVHLALGDEELDLGGIRDDSTLALKGDLADPDTAIAQHLAIHAVRQDAAPAYPLGDLTIALTAERDPAGLVHVTDLKVANGAGGTTLGLTGNVELGEGRPTLSVTTTLTQDLARLTRAPDRFSGRGNLIAEANVTSPDLSIFRVRAQLKGGDVSIKMPKAGIEMETANGEIPITVTLDVGANGVALRPDEKRSPYSMLRFADQHPLLSRNSFLSIASLKTPFVAIAPLVGNLEIQQNVVSLRQFEMGIRGGSITGQCGIDWDGPKSTLELHVRASGVQSSHGEPFDGNIAVVISAGDRTVEGRAEVLRIGERHLLDLLDMQDPMHVDPAMNRIRTALTIGYPDRLRLVFDHGFASARLELGGLARLISIGELRGIPMGPIVDKFLAPILDPSATKDAQ